MSDELIPDDVRTFVLRHIDSIAQWEALLLLRDQPGETWTVPAMAKRLYISEQEAADVLARLRHDGLADVTDDAFRYYCEDPDIRAIIDRLARLYSKHLIPVTNMIHGKRDKIRQFSDAFKFRRNS